MKRLILSALVFGAATQAAGCIIVSDDDPVGDARVTWDLVSSDANGNTIGAGCPAGATSAIVYSLLVDAPAGDAFVDKFNCEALAGDAQDLPTGQYQIWVRLTDDTETQLYAESGTLLANIGDGTVTNVDHEINVDHGFFLASWRLVPLSGPSETCAQNPTEDGVSIAASFGGGGLVDTVVDCEAGEGTNVASSDPLPINVQYTLSYALLDASQGRIGISATIPPNPDRALDYGNKFADLGVVDILLD